MVAKRALIGVLFFVLAAACSAGWENGWLHIGLNAKLDTVLTKNESFAVKPQMDGGPGLSIEFTPVFFLGFGLAYAYHWTGPSGPEGGFVYKAYSGSDLRFYVSLRYLALAENEALILLFGSNQGATARFDLYDPMSAYNSYLGVFAQPFLELGFHEYPQSSMQLSIAIDYFLRRDLILSAAAGLEFSFILAPFRKTWRRKQPRITKILD